MLHSISGIWHQKIGAVTFTPKTVPSKEGVFLHREAIHVEGYMASNGSFEEGRMRCWATGNREHTAGTSIGITHGSCGSPSLSWLSGETHSPTGLLVQMISALCSCVPPGRTAQVNSLHDMGLFLLVIGTSVGLTVILPSSSGLRQKSGEEMRIGSFHAPNSRFYSICLGRSTQSVKYRPLRCRQDFNFNPFVKCHGFLKGFI